MMYLFEMERWPIYMAAFLVGYLLGSIPFGLILTRVAGLGDIRQIGSGNMGATNVLRTGNKWIAFLTLALDMLKGTLAVFAVGRWGFDAALIAGAAAFIGHLYPCWLKYKGGKGVATYIGVLFGFTLPGTLTFILCWLAFAVSVHISSISAIVAAIATPLTLWLLNDPVMAQLSTFMSIFLIWRHRDNIRRYFRGEESKIIIKRKI